MIAHPHQAAGRANRLLGFGDGDGHIAPTARVSVQAFCARAETAAAMQGAGKDRRLVKAQTRIQMGGVAAAIAAYRSAPTPDVILIETEGRAEDILRHLDDLAQVCDPDTRVIVIGHLNDIFFYRELMRRGVSDYLIAPVRPPDIVRAVSLLFGGPDAEPLGRMIAVVGAKGGVGASTVAHNVAWAAAHDLAIETVIADLDLAFGTASLDYDLDPPKDLADAMSLAGRVDPDFIDRLLSQCADGLRLLAAPSAVDRTYDFAAESFDPVLDALRASAPLVVLDLPHDWTDGSRRILVSADAILIVAEPELASLRNVKNLLEILEQARPNDRRPLYCLNQVGAPNRPEIRPDDFATALQQEPVAVIPYEAQLFGAASFRGKMIAEIASDHRVCSLFRDLAQNLAGRSDRKGDAQSVRAR